MLIPSSVAVLTPTSLRADRAISKRILIADRPFSNHDGGLVNLGPQGVLSIGIGRGGAGGDPVGLGPNPRSQPGEMA